jgi:YD repeat-containing protein
LSAASASCSKKLARSTVPSSGGTAALRTPAGIGPTGLRPRPGRVPGPHSTAQGLGRHGFLQARARTDRTTPILYTGEGNSFARQINEPGNRVVTLQVDPNSEDLVAFTDADGFLRQYGYGGHKLTQDAWGPRNVSYGYGPAGVLVGINRGGGWTLTVTPSAAAGLVGGFVALVAPPRARLVDGLGHPTVSLIEVDGRTIERDRADGSIESWARNVHGDPTAYQDPRGLVTGYGYDGTGDVVAIGEPDGTSRRFAFDATFHHTIVSVDGRGDATTYTLNGSGDTTSMTDPLGYTTTYVWAAGLLLSTTDPDLRTTTTQYDGNRRPIVITKPGGGRTRLTYDGKGQPAEQHRPRRSYYRDSVRQRQPPAGDHRSARLPQRYALRCTGRPDPDV